MRIKSFLLGTVALIVGLPQLLVLLAVGPITLLDRSNGSLVSSGTRRSYLLYVPASYHPAKPAPLVISLHAGATWPAHQKNLSRWNRLAEEHGFLVVYPAGTPQVLGVVRIWHSFELDARLDGDVRFITDLIDTLRSRYNIEPSRIYANGMSNGGGMAFVLACELSDRIAAVAMVAPAQALPPDWCAGSRPVPMITFHGIDDPMVPYHGGPLGDPFNPVKPVFAPVRDFVARWAARNGCSEGPAESTVAPEVTRLEYPGCAEDAKVALYTVAGGGHTWPGGKPMQKWWVGATSNAIDATGMMWEFFRDHPLPQPRPATEEQQVSP